MVSSHVIGRVVAGLLALSVTVAGCSTRHSRESESANAAPTGQVVADAQTSAGAVDDGR